MTSVMKRVALCALLFVGLSAGSARAATVEVKVPFPFVVRGHTLPAGQYRLETDPMDPTVIVIRGEKGNTTRMVVLTMRAEGHDPAGDIPTLTFTHDETQYRLAEIWDSAQEGRQVAKGE